MQVLTMDRPVVSPRRRSAPELAGFGFGLTAALIWGAYLAMAKAGVSAGLTATDIAFLRFAVAGLVMLPWLLRHGLRDCAGVGWLRAGALALTAGPVFILVGVGGYAFAPLAHGAVLQPAAVTIASAVLAVLFLRDRPPAARLLGLGVMLGGLALIAGPGLLSGGSRTAIGDGMFLAAGAMWALFSFLAKRWNVAPLPATAAVSVLSAAVFLPGYLLLEGPSRLLAADPSMLFAQVIVQGLLSGVVAVLAFTKTVQMIGPARAAIFPAMVPAVAVLIGIPVAGELPGVLPTAGLAVATLGLLLALDLINIRRNPR